MGTTFFAPFISHVTQARKLLWYLYIIIIIFIFNVISVYVISVYVVGNFLSQLIFIFLLFLGMVMYANEFETKEN